MEWTYSKPKKQAGLSNTRITNKQKLEEIVTAESKRVK